MTFQCEELLAYQKSVDFAHQICAVTEEFTRGYGFLVDQLNRAALSISANIAGGDQQILKTAPHADVQCPLIVIANFEPSFVVHKNVYAVALTAKPARLGVVA